MPAPHHSVFYRPDALPAAQHQFLHIQIFINGTDLKLQLNTSTNVVPSKSDGGNQLN